jgi:cullin-5
VSYNVLFQDKGQLLFEDKWPAMRPIILKLLQQEHVTKCEWHDLFYWVHLVCLWDEKGPLKVKEALKDDIMDFIKKAQQVINLILAAELGSFSSMICMYCKLETKCRLVIQK